jgi:hypothetical protein
MNVGMKAGMKAGMKVYKEHKITKCGKENTGIMMKISM